MCNVAMVRIVERTLSDVLCCRLLEASRTFQIVIGGELSPNPSKPRSTVMAAAEDLLTASIA